MSQKVFRAALLSAALFVTVEAPAQAQSTMTRHVRDAVTRGQARMMNRMPSDERLRLDIVLPLRDRDGLTRFLEDIYNPTSPLYHHFLTVGEFTSRFGPTEADYDELTRYAESSRFRVVGGSRDGMDLQVEASVADIETAFQVSMGVYQHPREDRAFYAPDREPTMALSIPVWHISGLDNYSIPHALVVNKNEYANAHGVAPQSLETHATTGSGPSASFLGSDMRAAYYGGTLTGTGQNLGLLEFAGTNLTDLNNYFANIGQTNKVPVTLFSVDGTSTACNYSTAKGAKSTSCDDLEQTLDMTQALGMAPGLASLVMYIGSTDTAIISAMTTHNPLPATISCSWGWTPADPATLDPYFQRMAAQGQNFFAASGDASTWSANNEAWPADDANVVSVGGTDLATTSAKGAWKSETAWVDSGGGISPDKIAIPAWQQLAGVINSSNGGSKTLRNGPDVAANANFSYYTCGDQIACTANVWGGTSFAAPLWAGYMALVNQQSAANGNGPQGFINPALYSFGTGSNYGNDFHDITSGTSGSYAAVTGYDLVTGWGSPNGSGLLTSLAALKIPANFTLTASPNAVTAARGAKGTGSISTLVSGGFNSAVALSASGEPSGVTVAFSPASIAAPGAGSSTVTFTAASNAAPGTYTVTVTGSGGGVTHTATIALTVPAPAFALSGPSAASVAQGSKLTATVSTTISNGFSSAIALSAAGQPAGVTVTFTPASIAAPGSGLSSMTITAAANAALGAYPITITAAGGGITHSQTLLLQVLR